MNLASDIGYLLKDIQKSILASTVYCIVIKKIWILFVSLALLPRHYCKGMLQGHYILQGTRTQGTIVRDCLPDYYCKDISARELMPGK